MPRTASPNPKTRSTLLEAATRLILDHGYNGTSVDDICRAAGVTKGSFFHYFESKEELGRATLELFCGTMEANFHAALGTETDPWKRVLRFLDAFEKMANDPMMARGCLLGEFAAEMCGCSAGFRTMCCGGFDAMAGGFAKEISAAKKVEAPRATWKPRDVAEHFVAVLEGAMLVGKARRDAGVVVRSVKHFRAYLVSLMGK